MRLDKFLSLHSFGTRSEIKKMIAKGRVKVNGVIEKRPDIHIDEELDVVSCDDMIIRHSRYYYLMLHKPQGFVSATKDNQHTVLDLIDEDYARLLHPVGRLDKDTTGLLLLTNDGNLTHRLLAPGKHVDKVYEVSLIKDLQPEDVSLLEGGVVIEGEITLPAVVRFPDDNKRDHILLTIREGRYHQIKEMMKKVGNEVKALKRLSMGPVSLDPDLQEGSYRLLTEEEIRLLMEHTGLQREKL